MQSILRRLLHQFPLPLGSRTFWPPRRPGHLNRRLLDGLVLLLLFRFNLLDRDVVIVDVTTAGGEVAFLFLFFFSLRPSPQKPQQQQLKLVASAPPT
jgi:hypothetical protein